MNNFNVEEELRGDELENLIRKYSNKKRERYDNVDNNKRRIK